MWPATQRREDIVESDAGTKEHLVLGHGRAQEFFSLADIEAARPNLDPNCALPLAEFAGLVAKYSLKREEWRHCCLMENASRCRQQHGHGWVARRKDGTEAFIGKDCAHNHFGADSNFAAETRRINHELAVDDLLRRIAARIEDPNFGEKLANAQRRHAALKSRVQNERSGWPPLLLIRLQDMAKTGNRRVGILVHYVETDEKGKQTRTLVPAPLGDVTAPNALDLTRPQSIYKELGAAAASLREPVPSREMSVRKLRARLEPLERVEVCESQLEEIAADLDRFNSAENLLLLPWSVRRHDLQDAVAACALRRIFGRQVSDAEVARWKRDRAGAIRAEHGSREFQVDA